VTRRRWFGLLAFMVWTVFIWLNRLFNAWTSDTESSSAKALSTVLAVVLSGLAAASVVVLVRTWHSPLRVGAARMLQAFVVVTVAVWAVRVPLILLGDRGVPFKVVHAGLGLVAVALAVGVWRSAAPIAGGRTGSGSDGVALEHAR